MRAHDQEFLSKGTSGTVCKAQWRGMTVAVKRFYYVDEDEELISSFQVSAHMPVLCLFFVPLSFVSVFDMRAKNSAVNISRAWFL